MAAGQRYIRTVQLEHDPHYPAIEVWLPPAGDRNMGLIIGEFGVKIADAPRNTIVRGATKTASPLEPVTLDEDVVRRSWTLAILSERVAANTRVLHNELTGPADVAELAEGKRAYWCSGTADTASPSATTVFTARRKINGTVCDVARCYRLLGERLLVHLLSDNSLHECDSHEEMRIFVSAHAEALAAMSFPP